MYEETYFKHVWKLRVLPCNSKNSPLFLSSLPPLSAHTLYTLALRNTLSSYWWEQHHVQSPWFGGSAHHCVWWQVSSLNTSLLYFKLPYDLALLILSGNKKKNVIVIQIILYFGESNYIKACKTKLSSPSTLWKGYCITNKFCWLQPKVFYLCHSKKFCGVHFFT